MDLIICSCTIFLPIFTENGKILFSDKDSKSQNFGNLGWSKINQATFFFFFAILRPTEQLYPFISAYNVGTPGLEVPLFWVSLVIKVPSFLQSHLSIALCLDFCLKPSDLDKPGYSMISWVIFCCFLHALLCILH